MALSDGQHSGRGEECARPCDITESREIRSTQGSVIESVRARFVVLVLIKKLLC